MHLKFLQRKQKRPMKDFNFDLHTNLEQFIFFKLDIKFLKMSLRQ